MNPMVMLRMDDLKLGITATRLGMSTAQLTKLTSIMRGAHWKEFHGGDCVGGDAEAHDIITSLDFKVRTIGYPSNKPDMRAYKKYDLLHPGKPPLERNRDIVDNVDLLLGCPASRYHIQRSGTWATLRYAKQQERPFIIILPNGILRLTLPILSQ